MSAQEEHQQECRSSVKIGMTAKGDATVEVKVYVDEDADAIEAARQLAVATYNGTVREVRGGPPAREPRVLS